MNTFSSINHYYIAPVDFTCLTTAWLPDIAALVRVLTNQEYSVCETSTDEICLDLCQPILPTKAEIPEHCTTSAGQAIGRAQK